MIVVDGHLDLAFNHRCFGRDPRDSAREARAREADQPARKWRGECMVGLPELRDGRVALVFATIFSPRARDWEDSGLDPALAYADDAEAEALGRGQLELYRELDDADGSGFRLVGSRADLDSVLEGWKDGATGDVGLVPLMEGADPIRRPGDAQEWLERGIRIVGLSWRGTRYAGGTGEPGPLSDAGRELLRELDRAGLVLDLSHAAEKAFHDSLDLFEGPVIASHSNPRAVCPGDRQLTDEMIRRIGRRGGVIGAVPCNWMLVEKWGDAGRGTVPLSRVGEAIHHVAQVTGSHETVAIGSDFDGGFGAEAVPRGLDTVADLYRIGDVLNDLDFTDGQIHDILGGNWIRLLERALPGD